MKKSLFITATLLSAAITTSFAYAAQETRPYHGFERMDVNKDGQLSKDEVPGRLADNFDNIDRNGDGFISRDELPKKRRHQRGLPFAKMDADNDGKISKEEMMQHFDKLDTNNDGYITRDEQPRKGKHHKGAGFAKMDTNNDGKITKNEARGRLADNFEKLDTNGDGYLTKEELFKRRNKG